MPSAVTAQPVPPTMKPTISTGLRPKRSIARPATAPVHAAATRKIAGPSPSSPLTPVTRTNVSDETAATSCTTAELTASVVARISVLRRTTRSRSSSGTRLSVSRNAASRRHATDAGRTARRAPPRRSGRRRARGGRGRARGRTAAPASTSRARRRAVRRGGAGMRRHDVPEEHGVGEPELGKHAVDDRRRRLAGRRSRELPLRGERDARDARAAVSGGLADEQQRRVGAGLEVAVETLREPLVAVLVERVADPRAGRAALPAFPVHDLLERRGGAA